jgi:CheY-like chemotaxis protein
MITQSIRKYNWKGKKVLIVEDDPACSFLLSEILSHTRIEIQIVVSGTEAVTVCRIDPDIDIVLLNIQIKDNSGYEAVAEIRNLRTDLPIIAQSAYIMTEDKDNTINAGCNAHISKPVNTFELLGTMHQFLHDTDTLPL